MLKHNNENEVIPQRVVVLGASGFIGKAICNSAKSKGMNILALGRQELNLEQDNAGKQLAEMLHHNDALVFVAAKAPCKDLKMFFENMLMVKAVSEAIQIKRIAQVVYLSSDAVYSDSANPLTELSCVGPESFHGVMHLAREIALRQICSVPLAIVRPTLVYGLLDPHNGYGPNRFRRLAREKKEIILFGNGEEQRDHVDVEDVADLVVRILLRKSSGIINAVSGEVVSFKELAEYISKEFDPQVLVTGSARSGPMPHNGYRAFNNSAISNAFPDFKFKSWRQGISKINTSEKEHINK